MRPVPSDATPMQHTRKDDTVAASTIESIELPNAPRASTSSSTSRAPQLCCFVCEEPGGSAVCLCVDRVIHLRCQRDLMYKTPSHQAGCPVCKAPYNNVLRTKVRRKLTCEGWWLVGFLTCSSLLVIFSVCEVAMFILTGRAGFLVLGILFFVAAIFIVLGCIQVFAQVKVFERRHVVTLGRPQQRQQHPPTCVLAPAARVAFSPGSVSDDTSGRALTLNSSLPSRPLRSLRVTIAPILRAAVEEEA